VWAAYPTCPGDNCATMAWLISLDHFHFVKFWLRLS
jgi:hypothetical protein